jgi:hypothetical protein
MKSKITFGFQGQLSTELLKERFARHKSRLLSQVVLAPAKVTPQKIL